MALSGSFTSMSPSDLLQMLAWGSQTGLLACMRNDDHRHIFLESGNVVGVSSSQYKDRLGALLLRLGHITDEQFNKIFGKQASNGRPLGEIFKSENLLSEKNLEQALIHQAEEIIYDVVSWHEGDFAFEERQLTAEERRINPVVISSLLLEGARRMDEIKRARETLDDADMVLRTVHDIDMESLVVTRPQRTLLNALNAPMSLSEVFKMVNESEYDILTSLTRLMEEGYIEEDVAATELRREEHEKILKLLDLSRVMEEKGWFHEALSNIEGLLNREPNHLVGNEMKTRLKQEIIGQAHLVFPSMNEIPAVRHSVAAVSVDKLHFSPREGFVFSRIDGQTDIRNLRYLTGLPKDDLYIILHKFIRMGLIYLDEKTQKTRSRRV
ncbi:DUF4388 domain-containing protein [bacterium]|nr:DUF4388 domain-containing protein [candidate division CSSED10-310 bacterium]